MSGEYDVVVVGSGAGGMAAAITSAAEGLKVVVLEKAAVIGGSTAVSGGAVWVPNTHYAKAMGIQDSEEAVMAYLSAVLGNALRPDMMRAYLRRGPEAIEFFDRNSEVKLAARAYSPDYYPELEGAGKAGRPMDPEPYDGRLLGEDFKRLRDPLKEFTVLGGMMVNVVDVKHLLKVTKSFASWKHGMKLVLAYFRDRASGHARGTRLLMGNALAARLLKSARDRGVDIRTQAEVVGLLRDGDRVVGVQARINGKQTDLKARHGVVLATGGFPWDATLRAERFPKGSGLWSMAPRDNTGDGIRMARQIGADFMDAPADAGLWAPVSLWKKPDGSEVRFPHLIWDRAKPGLMAVNSAGRRFVNEGTSYHEFVRAMYRSHESVPSIPSYLICDRAFIDVWGLGLVLPGKRPRGHLIRDGYLVEAQSIPELAAKLQIDPATLAESVARFNKSAEVGEDAEFGKGSSEYNRYYGDPEKTEGHPNLGPINAAPFYAVRVYPGDIGTASGLRTDADARVLDAGGQPIAGLYACGNDMASVMGGHYPGAGITLGPALTFGYCAGKAIVASASR